MQRQLWLLCFYLADDDSYFIFSYYWSPTRHLWLSAKPCTVPLAERQRHGGRGWIAMDGERGADQRGMQLAACVHTVLPSCAVRNGTHRQFTWTIQQLGFYDFWMDRIIDYWFNRLIDYWFLRLCVGLCVLMWIHGLGQIGSQLYYKICNKRKDKLLSFKNVICRVFQIRI